MNSLKFASREFTNSLNDYIGALFINNYQDFEKSIGFSFDRDFFIPGACKSYIFK